MEICARRLLCRWKDLQSIEKMPVSLRNHLRLVATVITFGMSSAMGCGPSERDDSISLVRSIDAIDIQAPDAERRSRVASLKALPLRHESLTLLREACAAAHADLLDAEAEQRAASNRLGVATRRYGHVGIPPGEAQRIASAVRRSQDKLAQAETALPACMHEVATLRLKYRVTP